MVTGYEVQMYRHIEMIARSLESIDKSLQRLTDKIENEIETRNQDWE